MINKIETYRDIDGKAKTIFYYNEQKVEVNTSTLDKKLQESIKDSSNMLNNDLNIMRIIQNIK